MKVPLILVIASIIACSYKTSNLNKQPSGCSKSYDTILKMDVYSFVDEMPEYPEGQQELLKFITKNLKYPEQEVFQGTITYSFIVDKEGKLIDKKIYNKNKEDYTPLDKEALRVLELMPKWKIGKCNGEKVPVRVILPIKL